MQSPDLLSTAGLTPLTPSRQDRAYSVLPRQHTFSQRINRHLTDLHLSTDWPLKRRVPRDLAASPAEAQAALLSSSQAVTFRGKLRRLD